MKRSLVAFISVLSLLFVIQYINGSIIRTKGKWGDDRVRSFIPAAPEVSQVGNTIEIYFQDALSGLSVSIVTATGVPVYADCISSNGANDICQIPCELEAGDYVITLIHFYGELTGGFTVD